MINDNGDGDSKDIEVTVTGWIRGSSIQTTLIYKEIKKCVAHIPTKLMWFVVPQLYEYCDYLICDTELI